jgi:two-component sensor histidine kinase
MNFKLALSVCLIFLIFSCNKTDNKGIEAKLSKLEYYGKNSKLDSLSQLSKQLLMFSKENNNYSLEANVYKYLGVYGKFTKDNLYRIENLEKAFKLFHQLGDLENALYSKVYLSNSYYQIKKTDKALEVLEGCNEFDLRKCSCVNLARYYTMKANLQMQKSQLDEAVQNFAKALDLIKSQDESSERDFQEAVLLSNMCTVNILREKYNHGLQSGIEALKLFESLSDKTSFQYLNLLNHIGVGYYYTENIDMAREYFQALYKLRNKTNNPAILSGLYSNLFLVTKNKEVALSYLDTADIITEKYNANYYRTDIALQKANTLIKHFEFQRAIEIITEAFKKEEKYSLPWMHVKTTEINFQFETKQFDDLFKNVKNHLVYYKKYGMYDDLVKLSKYMIKGNYYYSQYDVCDEFYDLQSEFRDSLEHYSDLKLVSDLAKKYETEKKDQQLNILKLETQNKELELQSAEKKSIFYIVVLSLLLFSLIPVMFYVRQCNKNKILKASIQSSDMESARIARELHEGVSGTLTHIKHILDKENNYDLLEKVDRLSNEVRGLSHKLNVSHISKLRFSEAVYESLDLSNFPDNIDLNIDMDDHFEISNEEVRLNVLRVMQELTTNTLKHANASEIDIKLTENQKKIFINYSDNGDGCAVEKYNLGSGLTNIKERCKAIDAKIEIESSRGNGFYFKMEV